MRRETHAPRPLSSDSEKLCGEFGFETARICLRVVGEGAGAKQGATLRHMLRGVKQADDYLGSMRKKQWI
jgi:hypothetical protein